MARPRASEISPSKDNGVLPMLHDYAERVLNGQAVHPRAYNNPEVVEAPIVRKVAKPPVQDVEQPRQFSLFRAGSFTKGATVRREALAKETVTGT